MQLQRLVLTLALLPYFLFPREAFSQVQTTAPMQAPKQTRELLYQRVVSNVEKKMSPILAKLPQGNVMLVEQEKRAAVRDELSARIKSLETATNVEVAAYKRELIKVNESELTNLRAELHGYLNAMSEKELNDLGKFILNAPEYKETAMEYQSAFTQKEKLTVIKNTLAEDLSFLRSVYNKKIGLSTPKALIHDLEANKLFFQGTNKDNNKILLIAAAVLAGVALVSWGIASSQYGGRYKRAESAREQQLNALKADLQAKYLTYQADLTSKEQSFLRDNGFVRTVCGTYSQPDSKLCNRYNYQLFAGTKYCTVYCQKSTVTGNETMHEPAVCTSSFIPADCYDPNEYWNAYARGDSDGYSDGYDDGTYDGQIDGRDDGISRGRSDGESDGRSDGYDVGYDDGYDDGYSSGAFDGRSDSGAPKSLAAASFVPFKKTPSYLKGFKDGFEQYQLLFLGL